jgi:hypothetical protein
MGPLPQVVVCPAPMVVQRYREWRVELMAASLRSEVPAILMAMQRHAVQGLVLTVALLLVVRRGIHMVMRGHAARPLAPMEASLRGKLAAMRTVIRQPAAEPLALTAARLAVPPSAGRMEELRLAALQLGPIVALLQGSLKFHRRVDMHVVQRFVATTLTGVVTVLSGMRHIPLPGIRLPGVPPRPGLQQPGHPPANTRIVTHRRPCRTITVPA